MYADFLRGSHTSVRTLELYIYIYTVGNKREHAYICEKKSCHINPILSRFLSITLVLVLVLVSLAIYYIVP